MFKQVLVLEDDSCTVWPYIGLTLSLNKLEFEKVLKYVYSDNNIIEDYV
jgi:hypothetical protein